MKYNILIVDPIHKSLIFFLKKKKINFTHIPVCNNSILGKKISKFNILILRSGVKLDSHIIDKGKNLKLVIRAGSGTDNIDINYLKKKKIKFFNIPSQNSISVAELAIGLTFSVIRKISLCDRLMKRNIWNKHQMSGFELTNKSIGFFGYGSIAKSIIRLIKPFKNKIYLNVKNFSQIRYKKLKMKKINLLKKKEDIFKLSDIIFICVPLNKSTDNLINNKLLIHSKKTLVLINISRGGIVNEKDLYTFLKMKKILGAATDVFKDERKKNKLFELNNLVSTCHIGGMTDEAQERISRIIINKYLAILN